MSDIPNLSGKVGLVHLYMYRNCENGKGYIGVTRDPNRRFKKHANGTSSALAFNRAVRKYGIENFEFKTLAIFDDIEAANYHENAAIIAFGTLSPNGYNLVSGAPKSIYFGPMSQKVKEKIGKANQKNKLSIEHLNIMLKAREGKPGPNHGKKFSSEYREKLSKAHKSIPLSDEHRANMIAAHRTPESRVKAANVNKGKHLSPEHRAHISAGCLGKSHKPYSKRHKRGIDNNE